MLKKLILFLSIFLFLLAVGFFIASPYAVKFLNSKLQYTLGPGTTISDIDITSRYILGNGVVIIEPVSKLKLLEIDEIRLFPAIRSLLSKDIVIRKVILKHPVSYIYHINDSTFIGPGFKTQAKPKRHYQKSNKSGYNITIDNLTIDQGIFIFSNFTTNKKPAELIFTNTKSSIKNLTFPSRNNRSQLNLQSVFPGTSTGYLSIKGWFNAASYDCNLRIKLDNADILKFSHYYIKYLGNLFEKGTIFTDATVKINNHYIDANGTLQLNGLDINEQNKTPLEFTSKELSSLVKNNGGQIDVTYKINGNLQDQGFSFSKVFFESVTKDLLKSYGASLGAKGKEYLKEKGEEKKKNLKEKAKKRKESIERSIEKLFK